MGPIARILLRGVRVYQIMLSPLFSGSCRFVPSCSAYMAEAIERHGALHGTWLGLRRLGRCHPLGSSGFDPVPDSDPLKGFGSQPTTDPGAGAPGVISSR